MSAEEGQGARAGAGRLLLAALALLLVARLGSLGFYPLMDMTESRYADISRHMVQRGDWIVPWFTDTQPFWGKPVLSFWATAAGLQLLGVNEWGARLPHFLLALGVAALTWRHASAYSRRAAWHALAFLAGSAAFLVSAGAVMTDVALMLGTTLVMTGFWSCVARERAGLASNAALFGGLAIGLLAKGPIALVLCAVPIAAWALWQRRIGDTWRRVPWVLGMLAVAAMVVPWYAAAESRSPGFLQYFIVGEHWQRFLNPGWKGDLYGAAHSFPRGSIWVFALAALLPWSFLLPAAALSRAGLGAPGILEAQQRRYLLLWALWPCVFFSVAGNVLWTYVLPGMPAMALLAGAWTAGARRAVLAEHLLSVVLLLLAAAIPVVLAAGMRGGQFERQSMKEMVRAWEALAAPGQPLWEMPEPSFSASFYSGGRVKPFPEPVTLEAMPAGKIVFMLLTPGQIARMPAPLQARLVQVAATPAHRLMRWDGR